MTYWILPKSGQVISSDTVQRLTELEKQTEVWKERMKSFTRDITERLNDPNFTIPYPDDAPELMRLDPDDEDPDFIEEFNRVISNEHIKDADDEVEVEQDPYLNMEIGLPRGKDFQLVAARVRC